MARIVWDRLKDRKFETGVEKGVLYVNNGRGVPWNGLISVTDGYAEAEVQPRYQDGIKTHNRIPYHEYETEIEAFTYPDEFEECLGLAEVYNGIFSDEQARAPFGMTYQTKVGNAANNHPTGYKIHLIYNAVAVPSPVLRRTMGDVTEPANFKWGVKTAAAENPGFRPSSHFILDPERMGPRMFEHIYDLLYGASGVSPRLLYPKDIFNITDNWHILYPSTTTYPSLDTLPGGP